MTETSHAATAPGNPRQIAAFALMSILRDAKQLEMALSDQPGYGAMDSRDRAFARLLLATALRRRGQIEAVLAACLDRPPPAFVMAALHIGAVQVLFLDTPEHAAVSETVDQVKGRKKYVKFAGLTNAVMRRLLREGKALAAATPPSENLPNWIRRSWEKAYGKTEARRMALQLIRTPPLDLSVKTDAPKWAQTLGGELVLGQTVRLENAGRISALPGFDDGDWWVQDAAASLPVRMLGDVAGLEVLDMCAAPGGKTLQLAARGAKVTALDKSEARLEQVKQNLSRTGLSAELHAISGEDFAATSDARFDAVLLDAPCSATGTFRRHPDVLYNKTPRTVTDLMKVQRTLLAAASRLLKPGGRLVYCTCSLQPDEGEEQIKRFLSQNGHFSALKPTFEEAEVPASFVNPDGYVRTLPHELGEKGGLDGFFAALLGQEK